MPSTSIVTRRMIARETNLSATTVSLVLNNRANALGIKSETQQKVWEAAKRLNYTPNPLAVGLSGGRTQTLGIVWSLGGFSGAGEMTRDIAARMQKRGYLAHLADHADDPQVTERLLVDFIRRRVDAIVLQNNTGGLLEKGSILRWLGEFPAALLVSALPPTEDLEIDHLFHDRLPAYVEAADHFAKSGRRRLAIVGSGSSTRQKAAAFFARIEQHGVEIQPDAEIDIGRRSAGSVASRCRNALEKRFGGRDFPFDALMCTSDEMAVVAIDYLRRRGLHVPQDVAVIGFNDSLLAPYQFPPLASGDRQDGQVAAAIEEMILNRLDHPELPPQRRTIAMRFVWRESAG